MVNNIISDREYEITQPWSPDKQRSTVFSYKLPLNDLLFGFVDIYDLVGDNFDHFRGQNIQWLIKMKERSHQPQLYY